MGVRARRPHNNAGDEGCEHGTWVENGMSRGEINVKYQPNTHELRDDERH
jgi:hypothetical protein